MLLLQSQSKIPEDSLLGLLLLYRGDFDLARTIVDICAAQYHPKEDTGKREHFYLRAGDDSDVPRVLLGGTHAAYSVGILAAPINWEIRPRIDS